MARRGIIGAAVTLCLLVAPAVAHAADTFADAAIGSDANACTSAGSPCATIAAAIAKSGNGDTIRVGPGIYSEQVDLGGGRSLRATGTPISTVIDGPASPAIDVTSAAGTIEGFTIRGAGSDPNGILRLQAPAIVRGNVFDADDDTGGTSRPVDLRIDAGAGSPTVTENSFTDDGAGNQTAITSLSTGSPTISENRIDGFFDGVVLQNGTPTVSANVITATHNSPTLSNGTSISVFSMTVDSAPAIVANYIHSPTTDGTGAPIGISIADPVSGPGSPNVGATLRRNRVLGGVFGVTVFGTLLPVTLDSDLIAGTTIFGLNASQTAAGSGDVTATNVTIFDNATDVRISGTQLTLNSSIVGDPIFTEGTGPGCTITFSRLSATATPAAPSCDDAVTNDPPVFVDAAGGDYHIRGFPDNLALLSGGDPAVPPAGAVDFDGDPRELPPNGTSSPRREIGADELLPGDAAPPDTAVDAGPGSSNAAPSFAFSSVPVGADFECALDGRAFAPCASPKGYAGLAAGDHTFAVRASDDSFPGNIDTTPATRTFAVDATPPETNFDAGPGAGSTTDGSVSFTPASEPGATFECSLDGTALSACSSPRELSGLASGQHTFVVRAVDAVGNADPTAISRTWNVDATPPETAIDSGPADGSSTSARSATYGFSADGAATFECATDGGGFSPCTSPVTLENLAAGTHTFAVRATDAVGNADQTPASRSLSVVLDGGGGGGDGGGDDHEDTDPPETKIRKVKLKGDDAKVKFSSDEPGSTFRCKLDRKRFKPCRSPRRVKNLDDGRHRIKVQATDPAGNTDPSPAKKRFGV